MAMGNSRLLVNFFSLGIVQAASSLLQLIVIPFVIIRVGTDGFGVIAVAQVVMFYLTAVTEYGFNQTATREIALNREDPQKVREIFSRVFFSRLFLGVIAWIILAALVFFIPMMHAHRLLYFSAFAFVAGQSMLITWFFQGLEKMHLIALTNLLARVIFAALVFVFIRSRSDDYLFLFFLGVGTIIAGIVSIVVAFRLYRLRLLRPSWRSVFYELEQGWSILLSNLSISTCQYANIFILRFFTNDLVVGYYSIAERIFFTIRQLLGVFSQAIYPRVCQLAGNTRELVSFFKKIYVPFLMSLTAGCLVLFLFSPWVLYFFMREHNGNSVLLLRVLSVVLVISCLNIPTTTTMLAWNRKNSYFRVYMAATALNILCNSVLVYFLGATGTVLSILCTELFITLAMFQQVYNPRGLYEFK